jgi:hypothetical protein
VLRALPQSARNYLATSAYNLFHMAEMPVANTRPSPLPSPGLETTTAAMSEPGEADFFVRVESSVGVATARYVSCFVRGMSFALVVLSRCEVCTHVFMVFVRRTKEGD